VVGTSSRASLKGKNLQKKQVEFLFENLGLEELKKVLKE